MLRLLLFIVVAVLIVLVTLAILRTLAGLALFFIIAAGLGLAFGAFRARRRSGRRRSRI